MTDGGSTWADHSAGILEATTSLLLVTEAGTGIIVGLNRAAEDLTGYSREQVIGLPLWEIAAPAHQQMLRRALQGPSGAGLPPSFESTVNLRSGKPRRIVWSSTFLTDGSSSTPTHVVMTGIDMSSDAASGGLFAHLMEAANTTALVSTDRRGRVTHVSSGAELLLGVHAPDLVGEQFPLDLFATSEVHLGAEEGQLPDDLALLRFEDVPDLVPGSTGELLRVRDWTLVRPDGERLIASIAISAARDARGLHVGYVGVAHDVTAARMAHDALESAVASGEEVVQRLHELDRVKSDFVATLSHELRTPTASIVGCAEMLQDGLAGVLNTAQLSLVDSVARNSERLIALADDLVLLARADAGDLDLDFAVVDLRQVVGKARQSLQPLLVNRALEMRIEVPATPVPVRGDAAHLTRAVTNLLSNAVKFTDDGGLIACRLSEDIDEAVLEVSDSGVGIPQAEQRDLFNRFFRSSTAQERATQGSGLGLSIVYSVVQEHGGRILVDSDHLQGCTFTVRIPLTIPSASADTPWQRAVDRRAAQRQPSSGAR
jgi:PAS domain S-box-containing protein